MKQILKNIGITLLVLVALLLVMFLGYLLVTFVPKNVLAIVYPILIVAIVYTCVHQITKK